MVLQQRVCESCRITEDVRVRVGGSGCVFLGAVTLLSRSREIQKYYSKNVGLRLK